METPGENFGGKSLDDGMCISGMFIDALDTEDRSH
jgi:hypothetical protein